jgi:nucleotide sugar dehydrogenase
MTDSADLLQRIRNREATVAILGLGYVGLPLSLAFTEAGFRVNGYDINEQRIKSLNNAVSYVDDISNERLQSALEAGFIPSIMPENVAGCDCYVIAVPTGMDGNQPDITAVKSAASTIAIQAPDREILTIVSSTVYPGATQEIVKPTIDTYREAPARYAMVPERLDPGSNFKVEDIPIVVGANTNNARDLATALFDTIVVETYPVNSTETAELTKTLENTYRMVNIALVNELVTLAEALEANVWEAIEAAATKPFGFQPFRPGPGVGGHCIPIDPQFLTWRAKELGIEIPFLDDAHKINERMPALVADRLSGLLHARAVDVENASIVALGAAYKPNVGDTRNSPALRVIRELPNGCEVTIIDPHVDPNESPVRLVENLDKADISGADAVVLLVDHDAFDLRVVGELASFVFDTRNAMPGDVNATVVRLGDTKGNSAEVPRKLTRFQKES